MIKMKIGLRQLLNDLLCSQPLILFGLFLLPPQRQHRKVLSGQPVCSTQRQE